MKNMLHTRFFYVGIAIVLIGVATISVVRVVNNGTPEGVTATVTMGPILSIVSVSGIVEAENTAGLAFPVTGTLAAVSVREGDRVEVGQILATLEQAQLQAERNDAQGALIAAEADRDELIYGPRDEERDVTSTTVAIAEEDLKRTIALEAKNVENARRTLLSTGLEALPVNKQTSDAPPAISGTYTCDEGTYTLSVYKSGAYSGHSYRLSGLESGTYPAYTDAPAPLGDCGLFIQFDADEIYANQDWTVEIPNKRSAQYAANLNAYKLALQQEANNVGAKEQALKLVLEEQTLENASPREEALRKANAAVMQASARLEAVNARIADRTLRAPFAGTVNNVDVVKGESVTTLPIITIVADDMFELTARIPEIDITKLAVGQRVEVIFDARSSEVIDSSILFISPLAREIDGVAYFDAKIRFDEPPEWLRGGLNADVDIIVDEKENVLRIPKRFVQGEEGAHYVLTPQGNRTATTAVEIGFVGNDGFVEVIGLDEGDTIIAP